MSSPSFHDFFNRLTQVTDIENQSQLANILGVGRAAISLVKQKDSVPWKWIFTVAEAYGLNSNWLATGNGPSSLASEDHGVYWSGIPHARLGQTSSDDKNVYFEECEPRIAFPDTQTSSLISLEMTGPCMEPEIRDMDLVFVDRGKCRIQPGRIYALDIGGYLLIRRIDVQADAVLLICDNSQFPPQSLSTEDSRFRILGQVVGILRGLGAQSGSQIPVQAEHGTASESH